MYIIKEEHCLFHSFIQTKFVLMLPDAVQLNHVEKLKSLDFDNIKGTYGASIIAFPVDEGYQCSELKVDLRYVNMCI